MNNHPPYFYDSEIEWSRGRTSYLSAPGLPDIEVGPPPEFKGYDGMWTPEHLFVASVNSCFVTTFLATAEVSGLEFASFSCHARGTLEKDEGRGFRMTEIVLLPRLFIIHGGDAERAVRLLEKAERHCLISNSINTKVTLEPEIISAMVEELALN